RCTGGIFHQRVVDRFGFDPREGLGVGMEGRAVLAPALDRLAYRLGERGPVPGELVEEGSGLVHEDAAVPAVVAVGEERLGGGEVVLLDEPLDLEAALERGSATDVAEAGLRPRRGDAERDQPA